jgi:hypothetical protein
VNGAYSLHQERGLQTCYVILFVIRACMCCAAHIFTCIHAADGDLSVATLFHTFYAHPSKVTALLLAALLQCTATQGKPTMQLAEHFKL